MVIYFDKNNKKQIVEKFRKFGRKLWILYKTIFSTR